MNLSNAPALQSTPFANSGTKNTIPVASQIGITPGAASMTDGFPPVCSEPIASGGVPPFGADFNGILYQLSYAMRWNQAGGTYAYNSAFSTAISGYPKGALLQRADGKGYWLNLSDGNTSSPDSAGANWAAVRANIGTASIAMTTGSNTPTSTTLAVKTLLLTGSLASAATLVLPLTAGASWIVANNTTGAGTVTIQGASGANVPIAQGNVLHVFCDGSGYYAIAAPASGSYLPLTGTAVAATKLATARAFSISGLATASGVNFDGTANVALNVTALNVPGALGYTPANDANVVHLSGTETISGAKTFGTGINGTTATFSGAVTCTTMNATSSDRRLKRNIRKFHARPLHRELRMVSYELRADGTPGIGVIAQELQAIEPVYVGTFIKDCREYLSIDKASLAYEQAVWAAQEVDRLTARVAKLEQALERAKIEPRQRGFVRRVLESIW